MSASVVGRRQALAPSLLASVGIHLAVLAVIGMVWVPSVQRTLEHVIPVRLLPVAGDGRAGARPAPRREARAESRPRPAPARPAPVPAPERQVQPSQRPSEPVPAAPPPEPGPKDLPPPSTLSFAPAASASGAASDARGVAGALAELGRGDALGAGAGGALAPPGYRANPKPDYPPLAREKGYEGTVVLRVRVLPDGKAGQVAVERSSGHEILDSAAVRAVKAWLFIPATRNGIAVPMSVSVPIRFSLAS